MVMVLHGWGGATGQMRALVDALTQSGFRVVGFDLPGHGASSPGQTNAFEFLQSLEAVVELLGAPQAVVAHSMGAILAAELGRRLPIPLVLYAPLAHFEANLLRWIEEVGLSPDILRHLFDDLEQRYRSPVWRLNLVQVAEEIRSPVLMFHDEEDRAAKFSYALELAEKLADCRFLASKGLGHNRLLGSGNHHRQMIEFLVRRSLKPGPGVKP